MRTRFTPSRLASPAYIDSTWLLLGPATERLRRTRNSTSDSRLRPRLAACSLVTDCTPLMGLASTDKAPTDAGSGPGVSQETPTVAEPPSIVTGSSVAHRVSVAAFRTCVPTGIWAPSTPWKVTIAVDGVA